jgi:hypothetical protein
MIVGVDETREDERVRDGEHGRAGWVGAVGCNAGDCITLDHDLAVQDALVGGDNRPTEHLFRRVCALGDRRARYGGEGETQQK